jgi:hypothetical protein
MEMTQGTGQLTAQLPGDAVTRGRLLPHISLRSVARRLAAWWADDSMNVRFERERERDRQMLSRHTWL